MTEHVSIDRYTRFEPIGSGGFSRVYRAWRPDQDRFVAVKVLALGDDREIDRGAFAAECRAMGAVSSHPNVVTAFDNGFTNEGYPFIAMELCPEALTDRMRAAPDQRLTVDEVLSIGTQIFSALERAHTKGILHRDLKPQNILFTEFGLPALTDFGIAALEGDTKSQDNWALSRHYAAPEVINDEPHTVACDIYSLGATLYTALAGRRPFSRSGDNEAQRLEDRIRNESAPALDPDWVPDFVADEIMLLISKRPRDRPSTAADAAQRLVGLQERLGQSRLLFDESDIADSDVTEQQPTKGEAPDHAGDLVASSDLTSVRSTGPSSGELRSPSPSPSRRPIVALALLVVAIAALVAGVFALSGDDSADDPIVREPTTVPVDPQDAVVIDTTPPDAPIDVTIRDAADGVIISWGAVADAERYRVDFFGGDRKPMLVTETEARIERVEGEIICVEVVSVNSDGRLSSSGEQVCA